VQIFAAVRQRLHPTLEHVAAVPELGDDLFREVATKFPSILADFQAVGVGVRDVAELAGVALQASMLAVDVMARLAVAQDVALGPSAPQVHTGQGGSHFVVEGVLNDDRLQVPARWPLPS